MGNVFVVNPGQVQLNAKWTVKHAKTINVCAEMNPLAKIMTLPPLVMLSKANVFVASPGQVQLNAKWTVKHAKKINVCAEMNPLAKIITLPPLVMLGKANVFVANPGQMQLNAQRMNLAKRTFVTVVFLNPALEILL